MIAAAARSPSCLRLLALATTAWLTAVAAAQDRLAEDRAKGAAAATVADCKTWLGTLAGPEFEGRGTGQPGFEKAANFVAAHFKALGLEARGDNGTYFQRGPWGEPKLVAEKTFVRFTQGGKKVHEIPAERLAGGVTAKLAAKGDVVLLQVTVPAAPEPAAGQQRSIAVPKIEGLDDVAVKDKIVIAQLQGENREGFAMLAVQMALQGKGAAALLFAQTDAVSGGLSTRGGAGGARGGGGRGVSSGRRGPPQVTFGGDDFTKLLAASGAKAEPAAKTAVITATPLQAEIELAVLDGTDPAMNVWAVLPGSDPKLKNEYVVIGSHLDHLGKRGDRWFPGADDDGSGTTGVLAVSQMFAKNPVRPARSVLFVCFYGEENGLVGSGFFANNCPIPLSAIVGELQMDMIGRDEEENMEGNKGEKAEDNRNSLHLVGTQKLAPSLHTICLQKNETAKFDLEYDQEGMFSRSDHANFAQKGVPVAFFFTGLHRDYHQTTDTPDKIHYEKLLRVATYVYDIGFELASQKDRPLIEPELWEKFRKGGRGNAPELPAAPMQAGKGGDKAPGDGK